MHTHIYKCMYIYKYINRCLFKYIYIYMCVCMYICIHIYIYIYIYTYICVNIYIYIYIHIYMHNVDVRAQVQLCKRRYNLVIAVMPGVGMYVNTRIYHVLSQQIDSSKTTRLFLMKQLKQPHSISHMYVYSNRQGRHALLCEA